MWEYFESVQGTISQPMLLAVPNVSEGRDPAAIAAIERALAGASSELRSPAGDAPGEPTSEGSSAGVRLLDTHSDADHHRTVFTLAGPPAQLGDALLRGAGAALGRIELDRRAATEVGQHPHVGAIDVVPLVYLDRAARGAACAEALVVGDRIGEELGVPVFLYGALGDGRSRAELRRGGMAGLAERIGSGELRPDFGPRRPHPGAGATLVAARAPLVAFNLRLAAPASVEDARRIAGLIREGGEEGLPGLRAIGVRLGGQVAQVSMNVERPFELPLAEVVKAVARHAEVADAELVGLAPRAALEGFPEDVRLVGFDPARHVIENALGNDASAGTADSV
jgi:glutamate formiminotransferase/glutamate formiminotransferase/formiminotetrahydrofolate cyclodeaminase